MSSSADEFCISGEAEPAREVETSDYVRLHT